MIDAKPNWVTNKFLSRELIAAESSPIPAKMDNADITARNKSPKEIADSNVVLYIAHCMRRLGLRPRLAMLNVVYHPVLNWIRFSGISAINLDTILAPVVPKYVRLLVYVICSSFFALVIPT